MLESSRDRRATGRRGLPSRKTRRPANADRRALILEPLEQRILLTHFRYGNVHYEPTGNANEVRFFIEQAWRRTFYSGPPSVGSTVNVGTWNFGDGASQSINLQVQSINTTEDWFVGTFETTHVYSNLGPFEAFMDSCCRISTLENNSDGDYRTETIVNIAGGNRSPVSTLAPIVQVEDNELNSFQIPAFDADFDDIYFRLSDPSEFGGGNHPPGLSVSPTGLVTWDLSDGVINTVPGDLWTTQIMIADTDGPPDFSNGSNNFVARSGGITHNQDSMLEVTLNFPGGNLEFDRFVQSESCCDSLELHVDGTRVAQWASNTGQTNHESISIAAGQHTFRWRYEKDGSVNTGLDLGYIDNIQFGTGGPFEPFNDLDSDNDGDFNPAIPWVTNVVGSEAPWSIVSESNALGGGLDPNNLISRRPIDFILQVVAGTNDPPVFDQVPGPFAPVAGQPINFTVIASDPNTGDTVNLQPTNPPTGFSCVQVPSPPGGNPVESQCSWTPTAAQANQTFVVNFQATDNHGATAITSITFTPILPATIGDRVWHDLNANGLQDSGEPGLSDITVELRNADGSPRAVTFTDGMGRYEFLGLPPNRQYSIKFHAPTAFVFSQQDQGTDDELDSDANPMNGETALFFVADGVVDGTRDAGLWTNGSIHGQKFLDVNRNQQRDAGEPGLDDWTIELRDDSGNLLASQVTHSVDLNNDEVIDPETESGWYWFEDLHPHDYLVNEVQQAGWTQTFPIPGPFTPNQTYAVDVHSGENATGRDFGNAPDTGSLHGRKWEDVNGDSQRQMNEPWLDGWTIELVSVATGQVVDTQVTHSADLNNDMSIDPETETGWYWFEDVSVGNYIVREVLDPSWAQSFPTAAAGGVHTVTVTGGSQIEGLDFGNFVPGSIHGYKFEDVNANGIDDGEPRLAGVTITLTGDVDADGVTDTLSMPTNNNGEYWFEGLWPGAYTVTETPPAGSAPTTPVSYSVTVLSRQELVALSGQAHLEAGDPRVEVVVGPVLAFGNTYLGSIHGYKFEDVNANGINNDEPRLAGVTITLTGDVDGDGDSDTLSMPTNVNGEYWFEGLWPGDYTVTETPPQGTFPTTPVSYDVTVLSRQELVALPGQAHLNAGDPRVEVVIGPTLAFGNSPVPTVSVDDVTVNDRGREAALGCGSPPAEPDWRISRIRLSS